MLFHRVLTISAVAEYVEHSTLAVFSYLEADISSLEAFVGNQAEGDLIYQVHRVVQDMGVGKAGTEDLIALLKDVKPLRWLIHEDDFPTAEIKALFKEADEDVAERYMVAEFPWGPPERPGKKYLL
jgi:hypothetical protein